MTTSLTARTPEDLLAMVPVVFGFVPTDSIAMLTFGARETFHARLDLPPPGEPVELAVEALRAPAVAHGVRRVVFVLYSDQAHPAERVCSRLVRGFRAAGIEVIDVIRADGRRWFPMLHGRRAGAAGTRYDLSSHPFAAQAVLDGRVTHGSRAELADTLATDPARAAAVAAVAAAARPDDAEWLPRTARRLVAERVPPSDAEAARLLRAVGDETGWLALADQVTRGEAGAQAELWIDLLRRAPDEMVPGAAGVVALLAWLSGQGALAWCAVDRALALLPEHDLAVLVAHLLVDAVPPTEWDRAHPPPAA